MQFELSSGLHRDAVERVDVTFPFAVLLISIGSKSGTPFLPESAIACQHYFQIFSLQIWQRGCAAIERLNADGTDSTRLRASRLRLKNYGEAGFRAAGRIG